MCVSRVTPSWVRQTVVLALLTPMVAAQEFAGGTGDPNAPYQVATAQQLISIGDDPNLWDRHFVLVNDIDLYKGTPGGYIFRRAVIAPDTGSAGPGQFKGTPFSGTFDGGGHAIRGLSIHSRAGEYLGLFGAIGKEGVVRDLTVPEAGIGEFSHRGGIIAGWNQGRIVRCRATGYVLGETGLGLLAGVNSGEIVDCLVRGDVYGREVLGGLVGTNAGLGPVPHSSARIIDSHATARVFPLHDPGQRAWAGGLVGINKGSIVDSHATGSILAIESREIGGLVGQHGYGGTIVRCYAAIDICVLGKGYGLGGLVGSMPLGRTITDCYATGKVRTDDGSSYVGGLVGIAEGDITRCYSAGRVMAGAGSKSVGGLIGYRRTGNTTASFWDVEASGLSTSEAGTGLSTVAMKDSTKFVASGWDFVDEQSNGTADTWFIPKDGGYPRLAWEVGDSPEGCSAGGN